jgi:large subunit ribosomal protein L10
VLSRAQKEQHVAEFREKFGRARSVLVAQYRGLDVAAVSKLRGRLHKDGQGQLEYHVVKNSLLRLAVVGSRSEAAKPLFKGPTAVMLSFGDPVGLAKIVTEFAKDHEIFELRGGVVEGQAVTKADVDVLATLPSLDELRGKLVGLLLAPAGKLARLVQAPAAQLARVVEARRKALEGGGA